MKKIIYLANLANTYYGCSPSTIPLEIGYLKAYALSLLKDLVEIKLFRTFESLYQAVSETEPDIIGFAWYGWNRYLTTNALDYIKKKYPGIITVVGGANAPSTPENCLVDFQKHPNIDFIIPNQGEIPFLNLLKTFLEKGKSGLFQTSIDGVFYLSNQKQIVTGNKLLFTPDINIFPSPYLKGYLDSFLEEGLMPVMQTCRGCPYSCTFCVTGKNSCKRIQNFSVERVKKEIRYLEKKAKNKTIRFADENFGLLPQDLELAMFIAYHRKKMGYPTAIRLYTDKHINDNLKEIILLLKDLIPMNISTQTLEKEVLKNIRRINIPREEMHKAIQWAHQHNINATTELIFGLPGETYKSFLGNIDELVKLRLDSVATGTLLMLKETEINSLEIINRFGYKIRYSIAENGYTQYNDFESIEMDVWAVESKDYTYNEFIKMNLFNMIYIFFMDIGYFKEMMFLIESRGLKITEIISEITNNPERYPIFNKQLIKLKKYVEESLFDTEEEAINNFKSCFSQKEIKSPYVLSFILMGELILSTNQGSMIDEVINASLNLFKKQDKENISEIMEELYFLKKLIQKIIIPFWEIPAEKATISSPYDLIAWRNEDYRKKLSELKLPEPKKYIVRIPSLKQYEDFFQDNHEKPYLIQSELFFRNFRTANIRRYLSE